MDAKKLAKKREKKRQKRVQAKRSEKRANASNNPQFDADLYQQVFAGEGAEPLTDSLIRELVEQHGWPEQDLIKAREEGAQYSRPRHSLIFPAMGDTDLLNGEASEADITPDTPEEIERHKRIIEQARQEVELPDNTKFCGYVVHLPEPDEFLAQLNDQADKTVRTFAKIPDLAKRFYNYQEAANAAALCKQETDIAQLFDAGSRYALLALDRDPEASPLH